MEYWACGSRKKKAQVCPVGGSINHENLKKACAEVLRILDEFDDDVFLDKVDFINVPERYVPAPSEGRHGRYEGLP